jgi:hypothetical protein
MGAYVTVRTKVTSSKLECSWLNLKPLSVTLGTFLAQTTPGSDYKAAHTTVMVLSAYSLLDNYAGSDRVTQGATAGMAQDGFDQVKLELCTDQHIYLLTALEPGRLRSVCQHGQALV